ncbi:MAG: molybdate ABC transporter substrate-binding protein [Rhizonema sp. PD38]|nr:molybdate ABC transporter substrate-binding protein [Rhizonema sp. PD38]
MKKRYKLALATASIALGFGGIQAKSAQAAALGGVVYIDAAASLTNALPAVEQSYQVNNPGVTFRNTFGGSNTLAQQIVAGVPNVDIFFPVSSPAVGEAALTTVQNNNQLIAGTRQDLLTNTLAIIEPINSTIPISSVQDLANSQVRLVAIGGSGVPAGAFAQELFTNSGLGPPSAFQNKLVKTATDVRGVLEQVSSATNDTIDAGVVYTTDAITAPDLVKIAYTPPTSAYSPIIYGSAVLKQTQNPDAAKDFNSFLGSSQALSVFQGFGFRAATPVPEPLTIGGSAVAGVFGILMKRKISAKIKAKSKVAVD